MQRRGSDGTGFKCRGDGLMIMSDGSSINAPVLVQISSSINPNPPPPPPRSPTKTSTPPPTQKTPPHPKTNHPTNPPPPPPPTSTPPHRRLVLGRRPALAFSRVWLLMVNGWFISR